MVSAARAVSGPEAVNDRVRRGIAVQGIDLGKCDANLRELPDPCCDQLAHPVGRRLGAGQAFPADYSCRSNREGRLPHDSRRRR